MNSDLEQQIANNQFKPEDWSNEQLMETNEEGETALHLASRADIDTFQKVLGRVSSQNELMTFLLMIITSNGRNILAIAVEKSEEHLNILIDHCLQLDNLKTIMQRMLQYLIKQQDNSKRTVLHVVASKAGYSIEKLFSLLEAQDVKRLCGLEDTNGWLPLHLAIRYNRDAISPIVKAHGDRARFVIGKNISSKLNFNAIFLAMKYVDEKSLKILLSPFEDDLSVLEKALDYRDKYGFGALAHAVKRKNVNLLLVIRGIFGNQMETFYNLLLGIFSGESEYGGRGIATESFLETAPLPLVVKYFPADVFFDLVGWRSEMIKSFLKMFLVKKQYGREGETIFHVAARFNGELFLKLALLAKQNAELKEIVVSLLLKPDSNHFLPLYYAIESSPAAVEVILSFLTMTGKPLSDFLGYENNNLPSYVGTPIKLAMFKHNPQAARIIFSLYPPSQDSFTKNSIYKNLLFGAEYFSNESFFALCVSCADFLEQLLKMFIERRNNTLLGLLVSRRSGDEFAALIDYLEKRGINIDDLISSTDISGFITLRAALNYGNLNSFKVLIKKLKPEKVSQMASQVFRWDLNASDAYGTTLIYRATQVSPEKLGVLIEVLGPINTAKHAAIPCRINRDYGENAIQWAYEYKKETSLIMLADAVGLNTKRCLFPDKKPSLDFQTFANHPLGVHIAGLLEKIVTGFSDTLTEGQKGLCISFKEELSEMLLSNPDYNENLDVLKSAVDLTTPLGGIMKPPSRNSAGFAFFSPKSPYYIQNIQKQVQVLEQRNSSINSI